MRAILTYHSLDDSGSPISVSPVAFREHCEELARGSIRVLTLDALLRAPVAEQAVALTFDDGFTNFLEHAAPLLNAHAFPYTMFIATRHVGGRNNWGGRTQAGIPDLPLLSWDKLATLARDGMEIGAHTRTHPDLTRCDASRLADELQGGVNDTEKYLGVRPSAFAYPYGAYNSTVRSAAQNIFAYSCTTRMGILGARDDVAALPRVDMYYLRAPGALKSFGDASFAATVWARAQARRLRTLVQRSDGRVA